MKKHPTPPTIEIIKISELTVEKGFNAREPEKFKQNVKELRPQIEARGFLDPSTHVIQYVERDGKKLVRGGHTLLETAKQLGYKEVPACKTELDSVQEQLNLITSNTGKPLSQYEQGTVYIRLRDGQLRDGVEWDENGKVKEGKKVRAIDYAKDWRRKPMNQSEIADAIGVSREYVSQCVIVREAAPEISAKMLEGKISARGVLEALRGVKSLDKQSKVINAAIAAAEAEGKETATDKHVKAVKDQVLEKRQVAAPLPGTKEETSHVESGGKKGESAWPLKGTTEPAPKQPEPPAPDLFQGDDGEPAEAPHPHDTHGAEIPPEKLALFDGKIPEGKADLVKRICKVLQDAQEMPHIAFAVTAEEEEIIAVAIVKTLETPI